MKPTVFNYADHVALQAELDTLRAKLETSKRRVDELFSEKQECANVLESTLIELGKSQRQLSAATRCIYDAETYLELGSGKFAYGTIQKWRGADKEAT